MLAEEQKREIYEEAFDESCREAFDHACEAAYAAAYRKNWEGARRAAMREQGGQIHKLAVELCRDQSEMDARAAVDKAERKSSSRRRHALRVKVPPDQGDRLGD